MIKIGIDSGVITETEAKEYAVKMNEVHWDNLAFELIYPAVDYTKLAEEKKTRRKSVKPKEKKDRKPKAEPVKPAIPKIKIDFGNIKVKMT
jgi:spore germination cell wall hydrolase CwlJ-like protein